MSFISSTFHFLLMVHFIHVIYYDLVHLERDETHKKIAKIGLGNLKFLTFWDLLLQCGYFTLAFVNDVYGSNVRASKSQSALQKWRDFIFTTIGFSVATFVSVAFWGLYAVDRKLIFPVSMDKWFPNWLNHGMHSVPIIGVFIEAWLVHHKFPKRLTGVVTVACFTMIYLFWICFIAYFWDGFWVYPVLRDLSMVGRAIFIAGCSLALSVFYFLGEFVHNLAWGSPKVRNKAQ
ncbi:unnamed protein product [Meganyctiphanes norvegica]|uniref:Androgen-induced gene 1 protein n=1 Tax=Meganyctiphanes norvegica TaxID=48144 RepID=A0AAV2R3D4_MEGNR